MWLRASEAGTREDTATRLAELVVAGLEARAECVDRVDVALTTDQAFLKETASRVGEIVVSRSLRAPGGCPRTEVGLVRNDGEAPLHYVVRLHHELDIVTLLVEAKGVAVHSAKLEEVPRSVFSSAQCGDLGEDYVQAVANQTGGRRACDAAREDLIGVMRDARVPSFFERYRDTSGLLVQAAEQAGTCSAKDDTECRAFVAAPALTPPSPIDKTVCPTRSSAAELRAAVAAAESAVASADGAGVRTASSAALRHLRCLADPIDPQLAAGVLRTQGFFQGAEGTPAAALGWFTAAKRLDPGWSFPVAAAGSGLDQVWTLASASRVAQTPLAAPSEGTLRIDGATVPSANAPSKMPFVVQWVGPDDRIYLSEVYSPEDRPVFPAWALQPRRPKRPEARVAIGLGGLALAGGAGLFAGALYDSNRLFVEGPFSQEKSWYLPARVGGATLGVAGLAAGIAGAAVLSRPAPNPFVPPQP